MSDDDPSGEPEPDERWPSGSGGAPLEGAAPPAGRRPAGPDDELAPGWDAPQDASPYEELPLADAFLTMWVRPRQTIRRIVRRNPRYAVVPLAAVAGITSVLATMANRGGGQTLSVGGVLLSALVGGPILGLIGIFLGGWLVRLTGRWFLEGRGGPQEVRAALAWAELPSIAALPLWLFATAAFGASLFQESAGELFGASVVYALFAICVTALRIWGIALAGAALAEVQGYRSAWKGLLNLLLAVLLVGLIVGAVGVIVVLLAGAGMRLIS